MIVLVTSSFLSATSISLTSLWPLAKIGVKEGQTILKTVVRDGVVMGRIGGIASMSVIVITLCSPLLGLLLYKKNLKTVYAYILAGAICVGSVFLGIAFPVTMAPTTWMIVISVYVLIAAGVPVWVILQPRDFINVQILYGGIVLMIASLVSGGLQGLRVTMPHFNLAEGTLNLGFIWPMMFITIACGAISGFHCLVAGGTTGKQLSREPHARHVGYNAMLLESLLAVCVLLALGAVMAFSDYKTIVWPADPAAKSNPILGFSLAAGRLFHLGLGIPVALGTVFGILLVEGFVVTTLDAAVRLNRYLFEELWSIVLKKVPALLKHYWFNSGLAVGLMWVLAYSNAFNTLWPIFGTANQLLAAMALLTVSAWLLLRKKRHWFTLAPAWFMVATTLVSLVILLVGYVRKGSYILVGADLLLLALSAGVVTLAVKTFTGRGAAVLPGTEEATS
jgi:carbon starvation protein